MPEPSQRSGPGLTSFPLACCCVPSCLLREDLAETGFVLFLQPTTVGNATGPMKRKRPGFAPLPNRPTRTSPYRIEALSLNPKPESRSSPRPDNQIPKAFLYSHHEPEAQSQNHLAETPSLPEKAKPYVSFLPPGC